MVKKLKFVAAVMMPVLLFLYGYRYFWATPVSVQTTASTVTSIKPTASTATSIQTTASTVSSTQTAASTATSIQTTASTVSSTQTAASTVSSIQTTASTVSSTQTAASTVSSIQTTASITSWTTHDQAGSSLGYVLELDASDQLTTGAINVLCLQCLLAKVSPNIVLVEPFVVNSTMGALLLGDPELLAKENSVKLTDIYDNGIWVRSTENHHYSKMVSWNDFVENAPRDVILVQQQWEICDTKALKDEFSPFFKLFHFRVVRELCLSFKVTGIMSLDRFKRKVYGELSPTKVTVIIDRMCSIFLAPMEYGFAVNVPQCAKGKVENAVTINPSKRVVEDATTYIERYLGGNNDYISVMVRLEFCIVQHKDYAVQDAVRRCLDLISKEWKAMKAKSGLNRTFLTLDTGRFGSREFRWGNRGNYTLTLQQVKNFFTLLYGNSSSLEEWERSFEDVSKVSNAGYIASLQRAVAIRGRCIILGGGGSYQRMAFRLYTDFWKGKKLCYTKVD